jgi:hypothetical protein
MRCDETQIIEFYNKDTDQWHVMSYYEYMDVETLTAYDLGFEIVEEGE